MGSELKRPLGITILAIALIWIGFSRILYCLVFTGFSDLIPEFAGRLIKQTIHSHAVLTVIFYLIGLLNILFDIAYGVIGVGLWKLREWARKATVAISIIGVFVCSIEVFSILKPASAAIAGSVGVLIPFVLLMWYLQHPRVRLAFEKRAQA
jgi:hypothetical protein